MIVFLHIPKAGGATMNSILSRQYSPERSLIKWGGPHIWEERLSSLGDSEKSRLQLIAGHVRYGQHKYVKEKATYISMMRDPVDRIISQYYYIIQGKNHSIHDWVVENTEDIEEYVVKMSRGKLWHAVQNRQARRLAGLQPSREEDVDLMVQKAKENIKKSFAVIGTLERFDETLLLMKKAIGWDQHIMYKKRNVTKEKKKSLKESKKR